MIRFKQRGGFDNTKRYLRRLENINFKAILDRYGVQGVEALASHTPKDTGITADSWDYRISANSRGIIIQWTNSSSNEGVPIVILLQYGHGTANGAYVQGQDFINPAMKPVFERISDSIWKEVSKL